MRYVIWSGARSGINLPKSMAHIRHMVDASKGWRSALLKLPRPAGIGSLDAITELEINCHGAPGQLRLPDDSDTGLVDYTNVDEFGAMLKPSLAPSARIELLACRVALVNVNRSGGPDASNEGPYQYSDSVMTEYWGAWQRDPTQVAVDSHNNAYAAPAIPARAKNVRATVARSAQSRWSAEGNGLHFCQRLAARTGAIVRAAEYSQVEDGDASVDTFGKWEGHVWDFFPNGRVKYLGVNLPRTQGPVAWTPGRLREGHGSGRPMNSLASDSPLRLQRLNRSPLSV